MKIETIGNRGVIFTFDDLSNEEGECPTNVYVINGNKHIFVCDTFLGPESMEGVIEYIEKNFKKKPIIIFNSHYDYDHHWGNCAFKSKMILSHKECQKKIKEEGEKELETFKAYVRGNVKITPPTHIFENDYSFDSEGIYFFHSPGHTKDSSSCYDRVDRVLIVGDNVEEPIPYIRSDLDGVKEYIQTLKKYLSIDFTHLIPGHGSLATKELLNENLSYLELFPELSSTTTLQTSGKHYYLIHLQNLSTLAGEYKEAGKIGDAIETYEKLIAIANESKVVAEEIIQKFISKTNSLKGIEI